MKSLRSPTVKERHRSLSPQELTAGGSALLLEGLRTRPCQVLRPNALNMTCSCPWSAQGKLREGWGLPQGRGLPGLGPKGRSDPPTWGEAKQPGRRDRACGRDGEWLTQLRV